MEAENTSNPAQYALKQALDRMWLQFLPMMRERIAILETAVGAASGLSTEKREAAHSAAHKLAGGLGTFGLEEGTLLAREAEAIFAGDLASEHAGRLAEIASRLRNMIEGRT
jgi:HPt (histidine-containing phosphotransfer) domain-containing protein